MEIKFISEFGIQDFENVELTIQESNSRTSDVLFSKFTFPFNHYANAEFIKQYGDYKSYEAINLKNKISGQFVFENKIYDADAFIQNIQGSKITQQIDFGVDGLPNFDKKLSELPLEKFTVNDIYTFAKSIAEKTWPVTNFNFPRIYTSKYPTSNDIWKNFDGYINDLKPDGTEMRRNYIDGSGNIFNVNILQPLPHPIYLLKLGFQDAGFDLLGDIISDPNLQNKWVYAAVDYFTSKRQIRYGFNFTSNFYDDTDLESGPDDYAKYDKTITIDKVGKYTLAGLIGFFKAKKMFADYFISLNGSTIWSRYEGFTKATIVENLPINITIDVTTPNSTLRFFAYTQYHPAYELPMADLLLTSNVLEDLASLEEDSNVITNLNEIDLSRAVPDITFGEYFNVFKNWFNYDIDIVNKTVFMNRIGDKDISVVKDFTFLEVPEPLRVLLNKKSYLLQFPDFGDNNKDSMYYDVSGPLLNGAKKNDTSVIEINGYAMPLKLPKPGGYLTANVLKDDASIVALAEYSGIKNGQNNCTYLSGCDFPELFSNNWEKWLRQRINGQEFSWSHECSIEKFSQYSIKDYVFCFQNIHIIKSISKDKIGKDLYKIDFVTETVV